MPLVYHRRYQWPPARTESGRVVYRLDLILLFLMFFGLANVHVVFGWQALAEPSTDEYLNFALAAVYFAAGVAFAFHRRSLTFDPAEKTVKLVIRGMRGRREFSAPYAEVKAVTLRPWWSLARTLRVSIADQTADLASALSRAGIEEVAAEFEADTGMEVRRWGSTEAGRPPAGGG